MRFTDCCRIFLVLGLGLLLPLTFQQNYHQCRYCRLLSLIAAVMPNCFLSFPQKGPSSSCKERWSFCIPFLF